MIHILDAPSAGEPVQRANDQKEHALYELFRTLGEAERCALHSRIAAAPDDDELGAKLARFTAERRHRILSALTRRARVA